MSNSFGLKEYIFIQGFATLGQLHLDTVPKTVAAMCFYIPFPRHQLLHVAGEEGFKDALKERFLKAYFEENIALIDIEVLTTIMASYDWPKEKVKRIIVDQEIAKKVKSEIADYQQRGVSGVPFFIINDKYGISGAQPKEVFLKAFASVVPEMQIEEGLSCDPEKEEC